MGQEEPEDHAICVICTKIVQKIRKIEFKHTPRTHNELANALSTVASMIKHPDTDYTDPMDI